MADHIGLRFGALGASSMHLCIDMQCQFGACTPWPERVLPTVTAFAERIATRTTFTRARQTLDPDQLELVLPLRRLVPPATVLDKHV